MKPLPCVVDRWAGGSLTRRPKGPFAVSWPRQLGEYNVNTITITIMINKFRIFYSYAKVQLQVFCVLIRWLLLFWYRFYSLAYSVSRRIPKLSPWLCEKGIKQWDRLRRVHSHSIHEVTRNISHSKQEDLKSGLKFEFCYNCYQNLFHYKQIKSEFSNQQT